MHAYEEHGTLTIANVQIDDSGVYVCKAEMEEQIVEESVTITVIRGILLILYHLSFILCIHN